MPKLKCKCNYLLNDDDIIVLDYFDWESKYEFDQKVILKLVSFINLEKKEQELLLQKVFQNTNLKKDKWMKEYISNLLSVDFPANEIWVCPKCGRWWVSGSSSLTSYLPE